MRLVAQPFANRRFKPRRAIAKEQRRLARRFHAVKEQRQLLHHVFQYALPIFKHRAVDLLRARVENRADHAIKCGHVCGQRFQRIHRDARLTRCMRKRFHRGYANPHAGKRAGTDHRAEHVHILKRHIAHLQRRIHHRHDALAVRLLMRQLRLINQPSIRHDRHAARRAGCINHQNVHRPPPTFA